MLETGKIKQQLDTLKREINAKLKECDNRQSEIDQFMEEVKVLRGDENRLKDKLEDSKQPSLFS